MEDNDEVLVMQSLDGKVNKLILSTSFSENMQKTSSGIAIRQSLDYQPSNLNAEESTAWKALSNKENVKMLGGGSRRASIYVASNKKGSKSQFSINKCLYGQLALVRH
ncbi:hypothetical protein O9929_17425 [Vibrio lentus]|nr:hypothetical protein [Vibrio lentus]